MPILTSACALRRFSLSIAVTTAMLVVALLAASPDRSWAGGWGAVEGESMFRDTSRGSTQVRSSTSAAYGISFTRVRSKRVIYGTKVLTEASADYRSKLAIRATGKSCYGVAPKLEVRYHKLTDGQHLFGDVVTTVRFTVKARRWSDPASLQGIAGHVAAAGDEYRIEVGLLNQTKRGDRCKRMVRLDKVGWLQPEPPIS